MTREEAIKFLKSWNPIHPAKQEARDMAVEALKQPEIVLCKDCKKNGTWDCPLFTDAVEMKMDDNWSCADGER